MFQKNYFISGMTCQSCVARVQAGFLGIAGVVSAEVSLCGILRLVFFLFFRFLKC